MIRILIFLLVIVFVSASVTYLSGIDSRIEAEAFGLKYNLHTGFILGAVGVILGFLVYFTSLTKDILALPAKVRARQREAKQERGMAALARGMESVMVGDAVDAQHHARIARRNLEHASLTRLLTAQAAQLAGDDGAAKENFALMLEAPETEFLGLHGLYAHAKRAGDDEAARRHAERAFELRPNARWAFDSVLDLNLARGAWGETREVLKIAKANRLLNDDEARRGEAALLTADAYAAGLSGDAETAQKEAEAAFRLCPELTPAAVLAATAMADRGKKSRAAKVLEQSFAAYAHPAIGTVYRKIFSDDNAQRQAAALDKLAKGNPDSHEGKFIAAQREAILENWDAARDQLEALIVAQPMAREFTAMAEAMGNAHGADAAQPWLQRAATAPRNPEPGADGAFNFTRAGWARLVREFIDHGRLAPPPLEDRPAALTREEIRLIAAPTASPESASTEETTATDAPSTDNNIGDDAAVIDTPAQEAPADPVKGDLDSPQTKADEVESDTDAPTDKGADGKADKVVNGSAVKDGQPSA
ncbi:MAG: heme biosynthesis HemY N-terminal domain-containing protein [Pseudomonadota bacterium]